MHKWPSKGGPLKTADMTNCYGCVCVLQLETNSPGLVVAVTVDGKEVWTKGRYI